MYVLVDGSVPLRVTCDIRILTTLRGGQTQTSYFVRVSQRSSLLIGFQFRMLPPSMHINHEVLFVSVHKRMYNGNLPCLVSEIGGEWPGRQIQRPLGRQQQHHR